jgi:hypothetical protein
LRHRAVGSRNDENRAVHLRRAGDHVLHIVGVARTVDVRVVALVGFVFDVAVAMVIPRSRSSGALSMFVERGELGEAFGGLHLGDRRGQGRLAVVNVTDGADVDVGFVLSYFCLAI